MTLGCEMKKKLPLIILILIVLAAGISLYIYYSGKGNDGRLVLSGNIEVTEPNVGFKTAGRIVDLQVDEGDAVKTGQRLAGIDSAEQKSILAQYSASLKEARNKLNELLTGSRKQEIEQAQAIAQQRKADLDKAHRDYERNEVLFGNGAISSQRKDESVRAYKSAKSLYENALATLSLVKEGPRQEEIQIAKHKVEQAMAAVRTQKERLDDTVIYSPIDGVILRKNVELGEIVSPGMAVYTIGDLAHPWVKVYVKEDKLGLVKLGQKARVTVDTFKGKTFDGTVTYISSEAEFTPKNVQTKEERVKLVFGIKVSLDNKAGELKPGMPADVEIVP